MRAKSFQPPAGVLTVMKLSHRQFLRVVAGAAVLPALSRIVRAQAYPMRPVRLVVGFPPGQTADLIARLMGQWLTERLGQPVIIDNRPGASSNIATESVVRSPADGYTLLSVNSSNLINATLYEKLPYNFLRDIDPIASFSRVALVMEVNPSFPARTVPEFIAYAKANPGKINMASGGTGNSTHVTGELFKMMAGVDLLHVPYRGSPPALTDLIGERVQVMFDVLSSSVEHIRSGRLRARRDHREAQQGNQRGPRRSQDEVALCGSRAHAAVASGCRLCQARRRRNREVGQGGEICEHQAGVRFPDQTFDNDPICDLLRTAATGHWRSLSQRYRAPYLQFAAKFRER